MYQFTADKRGEVDKKTPLSATVSSTQEKKKNVPHPHRKFSENENMISYQLSPVLEEAGGRVLS